MVTLKELAASIRSQSVSSRYWRYFLPSLWPIAKTPWVS